MLEPCYQTYLQQYLDTLPPDSPHRSARVVAEQWGDHAALADELGNLIAAGTKTATCSSMWWYEASGEPLPEVGLLTIALDGRNEPLCIVETTELTVRTFDEVDEAFAYDEGEDDRTLAAWRIAHQNFFGRVLPEIGREVSGDMPLLCERFRLVYPPAPRA